MMSTHYGKKDREGEDNTYSSLSTNGQMVPVFERSGIRASRTAFQTTFLGKGTGRGPNIAGGSNSYAYGDGSMDDTGSGAYGGGYSGGTGGPANLDASDAAAADPFNLMSSPVLWAAAFFVIGMLGLRYVHWRG